MKTIGIIGSRQRNADEDFKLVYAKFRELYEEGDWICSGWCDRGGDWFAVCIAEDYGIPFLIFPPGKKVRGVGKYFARNDQIARHSDVLIACAIRFPGCESKGGTWYTVRKWREFHPETTGRLHIIEPTEEAT